jgi:hypothetical protein
MQDVLSLSKPWPLVIWHGLGNLYALSGMEQFHSLITKIHPRIFIHSVYVDLDAKEDQWAHFYRNVDDQVERLSQVMEIVCLHEILLCPFIVHMAHLHTPSYVRFGRAYCMACMQLGTFPIQMT